MFNGQTRNSFQVFKPNVSSVQNSQVDPPVMKELTQSMIPLSMSISYPPQPVLTSLIQPLAQQSVVQSIQPLVRTSVVQTAQPLLQSTVQPQVVPTPVLTCPSFKTLNPSFCQFTPIPQATYGAVYPAYNTISAPIIGMQTPVLSVLPQYTTLSLY